MGLIKSGYPSLSMCRTAAHAAYGGNKPMPHGLFPKLAIARSEARSNPN